MNKDDTTESIKETFNVSLENREILPSKNNSKVKLTIAIISTVLILAAATTLLIGYFKFDLFKNEIQKVDANLTREVNQANFFSENKKINTRIALTKDNYEEQTYEVNTDFMIYLKDKTELENKDYLYSASIVILKSKMTTKGEEYELPSFDIKDEKKKKEFEANPNGSKYPIGYFTFYENGTIADVQFPESADEYNIETLKELIEKVIPKLSRNRTDDNTNGLNIKTRTDRKKKTLIEEEKPKQYHSFKGSKFSKYTERDIEYDKITGIRTDTDIHLQSIPEENEQILGATDFYYKTESNIKSYEWDWNYSLDNGYHSGYYGLENPSWLSVPFVKYGKGNSRRSSGGPQKSDEMTENGSTRRLGQFGSISAEKYFTIGNYNVLGQSVTIQYHVGVSYGNPFNEIVINSNLGTATIGNTGINLSGSWSRSLTIFSFTFPSFPLVTLNALASGYISWGVSYTGSGASTVLYASLSGSITLGCEVKAGWDPVASFSAGIEGVIVSASGYATIKNRSVEKNFSISAGRIYAYLDRSILGNKERVAEKTLYAGWQINSLYIK